MVPDPVVHQEFTGEPFYYLNLPMPNKDEMTKTKADYFLKKKKDIEQYFNKTKKLMKTMKNLCSIVKHKN